MLKNSIAKLASLIAERIDIPKVPEFAEEYVIERALELIDGELEKHVSRDWLIFIEQVDEGFTKKGIQEIKENVVGNINRKLDIPFVDEETEGKFIAATFDVVISLFEKGKSI